jgi:hypothetical protein
MSQNADTLTTETPAQAPPVVETATPTVASQPAAPHARLQRDLGNAAIMRSLIQRKAEAAVPAPTATPASPAAPTQTVAPRIVDDKAEALPGQMHKTEFLTQLRLSVCNAAAEAFRGTRWSEEGCPYIDRVFAYCALLDSERLERFIRRYAPETASVASAAELIPLITTRVQRSLATWVRTGQLTGVPEDIPVSMLSSGVAGAVAGIASGFARGVANTLSNVANLFYKHENSGTGDAADPVAVQSQLNHGHSLDAGVRTQMESAYGRSFGDVRVHTDPTATTLAKDLKARAFTVGNDVAFAPGEYQPGTLIGDALIAHELAHVAQQSGAQSAVQAHGSGHYGAFEEDADHAAVGAMIHSRRGNLPGLVDRTMPALRSGLRLQRCGPDVPPQTINWQDINRPEYEASVKKIRDLHQQEKKLLAQGGWDDKRTDELARIQTEIANEVKILQGMGIRRDAQQILKLILDDVPKDLLQVTGSLKGGETPIYWGEKRQFTLNLDYVPKDVDYGIWWAFDPGTRKQGIFRNPKPGKELTITLNEEFWEYWDRYGAQDNKESGRRPGFFVVADLFLGGDGKQPDKSFYTPKWIDLQDDKVPSSITINSPRIISLANPNVKPEPGKPAATTDYVLQDSDIEFNLSWNVPVPGVRNPKYGTQWSITDPDNTTVYWWLINNWKVNSTFKKTGKYIVGADVYPLSKKADNDVKPVVSGRREIYSISHEQLGELALDQSKKLPKLEYGDYLTDLDKQIADIQKMQKAGSPQGKELAQRLEDLKSQRDKVVEQVGTPGLTLPFPDKEENFNDKVTYVSNISAVLSTPEYGGAFPLTVFVTMIKKGSVWNARITDTTTKDVIHFSGSATTPRAAMDKAIVDWHGSNEYPEKGSLHYSFDRAGWNLRGHFGLDTFKKSFWKWFDRILFIAQAIVALVLLLIPEPTGLTKVAGIALLSIGILRSAYNIYQNWALGRPVLDQRNVLEAISMVASVVGIKGGMMMGAAGKGVALGEQLTGRALVTFRVGQGLVLMSSASDVGTFVYVSAQAISDLQAVENDPSIPESEKANRISDTYLRLFSQGLLILGSNAHLFQGAKPRGTNLGKFLEKVDGGAGDIKLDPWMRTRLQSEFKKLNSEVDVETISDRDLVMGLQVVHTRAKTIQSLEEIRNSLEGKSRDAFDRLRGEYKNPEEFAARIANEGNDPKAFFARLAADHEFMTKKVGPDMPYAEQMQRMRRLDSSSRVELAPSKTILLHEGGIDIAPDNQIRINGQIDMHPSALKDMSDAQITSLLEVTKALKDAKGDPTKLTPDQQTALNEFTKTSGFRFRFDHQRKLALAQLAELGVENHPLFKDIPQEGQNRLFDLIKEGRLKGAPNLRKQGANWALARNPDTVQKFVDLCQFYFQQFEQRANAKRAAFDAEVAKRQAANPTEKPSKILDEVKKEIGLGKTKYDEFFRGQTEAEMGSGTGKPGEVNQSMRDEIDAAYNKSAADPAAKIVPHSVDPSVARPELADKVKSITSISFAAESSIVYHTEKHYGQLPPAEQAPPGGSKVEAYMKSARLTISTPTSVEARAAQNGGTIITYTRQVGAQTMKAFVYVSLQGDVFILTFLPQT